MQTFTQLKYILRTLTVPLALTLAVQTARADSVGAADPEHTAKVTLGNGIWSGSKDMTLNAVTAEASQLDVAGLKSAINLQDTVFSLQKSLNSANQSSQIRLQGKLAEAYASAASIVATISEEQKNNPLYIANKLKDQANEDFVADLTGNKREKELINLLAKQFGITKLTDADRKLLLSLVEKYEALTDPRANAAQLSHTLNTTSGDVMKQLLGKLSEIQHDSGASSVVTVSIEAIQGVLGEIKTKYGSDPSVLYPSLALTLYSSNNPQIENSLSKSWSLKADEMLTLAMRPEIVGDKSSVSNVKFAEDRPLSRPVDFSVSSGPTFTSTSGFTMPAPSAVPSADAQAIVDQADAGNSMVTGGNGSHPIGSAQGEETKSVASAPPAESQTPTPVSSTPAHDDAPLVTKTPELPAPSPVVSKDKAPVHTPNSEDDQEAALDQLSKSAYTKNLAPSALEAGATALSTAAQLVVGPLAPSAPTIVSAAKIAADYFGGLNGFEAGAGFLVLGSHEIGHGAKDALKEKAHVFKEGARALAGDTLFVLTGDDSLRPQDPGLCYLKAHREKLDSYRDKNISTLYVTESSQKLRDKRSQEKANLLMARLLGQSFYVYKSNNLAKTDANGNICVDQSQVDMHANSCNRAGGDYPRESGAGKNDADKIVEFKYRLLSKLFETLLPERGIASVKEAGASVVNNVKMAEATIGSSNEGALIHADETAAINEFKDKCLSDPGSMGSVFLLEQEKALRNFIGANCGSNFVPEVEAVNAVEKAGKKRIPFSEKPVFQDSPIPMGSLGDAHFGSNFALEPLKVYFDSLDSSPGAQDRQMQTCKHAKFKYQSVVGLISNSPLKDTWALNLRDESNQPSVEGGVGKKHIQ